MSNFRQRGSDFPLREIVLGRMVARSIKKLRYLEYFRSGVAYEGELAGDEKVNIE